jgi:hypothetical protein
MRLLKRTAPIAVSLTIIVVVTAILFFFKDVRRHHHLVFFYLFPTAFVAMLYGSVVDVLRGCGNFDRSVYPLRPDL